jgi:hypothetical protein
VPSSSFWLGKVGVVGAAHAPLRRWVAVRARAVAEMVINSVNLAGSFISYPVPWSTKEHEEKSWHFLTGFLSPGYLTHERLLVCVGA